MPAKSINRCFVFRLNPIIVPFFKRECPCTLHKTMAVWYRGFVFRERLASLFPAGRLHSPPHQRQYGVRRRSRATVAASRYRRQQAEPRAEPTFL